jgi:glycosyltransferase involved in cell wall biosynthesis
VSTSIATFRDALAELGVEVRLVAPRYGDEADEAGVVRVAGRRVPRDPEDRLASWRAMRRAVLREAAGCELVHIQTPFVAHYAGLAAARALRLPAVLSYHTFFEEYLHHYAPFLPAAALRALARRMSRAQCNAVDGIVVPSTAMRDRLAGYGVRRPLHVLPTGIPLHDFSGGHRARFRARHGIAAGVPMALFIGRLAHEKNIGFLLEVAARVRPALPGFVLVIAGEGPAQRALERQAQALDLRDAVRFVGYLDRRRELRDCYAAADAFVFASRTETQGLVLIEAMAAGLPVVAVAAMGTIDILAPRRGALVAPDEPAAFARLLLGLLQNPAERRRLAADGRRYSIEWGDAIMAGRLAALYRHLLAAGATAGRAGGRQPG